MSHGKCSGICYHHHHHHDIPEGLGVFPVPWSSRWSWSLHLFLGLPMLLRPFGLYCSTCFGSLFVSVLQPLFLVLFYFLYCVLCSRFLPNSSILLSTFVIPSKCLKNFICVASKRCSSLFFSTRASLPNSTSNIKFWNTKLPINPGCVINVNILFATWSQDAVFWRRMSILWGTTDLVYVYIIQNIKN